MSKRVPLVGEELRAYEEEQNRIKEEEALNASLSKEEDLKMSHGADDNVIDPICIHPMFPFFENSVEWDEFGEVINPDDYVIKEEDIDQLTMLGGADLDNKLDEGRSDGHSIKSILAHVAPLKLVLVHGSAEATEHLKQHCLQLVCSQVYAPQIGETIDVTSDLCAYKVQLSEGLISNVFFKKLGDYEIAWVDAEVGKT
ncbi:hypothetical protein Syun_006497 [Stephania yunnanensis]|uniref:Cleavage and polyadenylation specificity factor subunit 2 n=1 Tax=Stephania yunnanensis TaxID=152371 RepID=A0AAP0KWZ6_9MAGN